jgi:hypothetical protein
LENLTKKYSNKYLIVSGLVALLGLVAILAFIIFSASDLNVKVLGRENLQTKTEEGGNLNEGSVPQNEVEGERGQGTGRGVTGHDLGQTETDTMAETNTQKKNQTAAASRLIPPYASGVVRPTAASAPKNTKPFEIDQRQTISQILENADLSDPQTRAAVVAHMTQREQFRYAAVLAKAEQMNIPVRIEGPGHNVSILYDIRPEGPLYRKTLNTNAAISTGADLLNQTPYGLNGEGMTVGVWDAARARTNHVELAGKVTVGDSTTANDDHSTHVAGTIAAKGIDPKAKGMGINTLIRTYDWNSDYAEMTAIGAAAGSQGATKLPISNHSYGLNATAADMGRYETECNTLDALALSLPYYLVFWAAGNEQDTLNTVGNGYQSITFNGLAKNVLTVGAADDAVTSGVRDVSKGTLAYFSSMGPCDDGRIKPDIVANGVNVYSCIASNNNTSYDGTYSGTSMATPNAAGTAALLVQLYKTNFSGQLMRASMLKALMIHTADDVGRPGPDYQYGWGYMNGKTAADVILSHKASLAAPKMIEDSITTATKTRTTSFVWDGTNPIRATLVWTDPAGAAETATNSRTRNLVNDLDLKITAPDGTITYLPYVMPFVGVWTTNSMTNNAVTGTNKVDNVERVDIATPVQAGTYTVTVGMYGTNSLSGTNQIYSLIVTGGQNVEANPPPVVNITAPADGMAVLPGSPVTITATATDMAVAGVPGSVTKVEFFDGETLLGEDTSAPYSFSWTPFASGVRVLTAKATDNENAGATSSPVNVTVLVGDGKPTISGFSPSGGVVGDAVVITGSNLGVVTGVQFGALTATFKADSAAQITALVPANAVTAPITVTNSHGSATTITNFNILPILFREDFSSITGGNNTTSGGSSTAWVGNTNFPTGTSDWEAGGAVRLGSGSAAGSITSRAINLSGNGGAFTVSFKVKGWATVEGQIKVTAGTQSQTVSYTATMSGEFETKSLNFTGGTSATTIKIESTAKRAFIDDVTITAEAPSSPPVITSPSTGGGIAGQVFSYQITASNSPTSFGASNLPSWASINTTSGVISGATPTAGTNVVTISASNSVGVASTNLTITILPSGGGGGGTVLSENFLTLTNGGDTATTGTNSPSTTEVTNNLTTNFPVSVKAYSSGGVVKLGSSSLPGSITSRSLDLSGNNGNFTLSFKVKGWSTVESGIKVTVGSLPAQTVNYTSIITSSSYETKTLSFTGGQANSTIRLETTNKRAFIDDVIVTASAPAPSITVSGTLLALNTVYGTASANPSSFTVSGANLAAGITVAPPSGFEVSATNTNNFAGGGSSIIVGSGGTVANTTVFVRLAAGIDVGTYSGNMVCSSVGATDATVATVASIVSARPVTVTANLLRKTYGSEDPELTYSASEPAPFIGALARSAGENVGIYVITQGDLSAGPNYTLSFTGNNFEITRKSLNITAGNMTKTFGQSLVLGAGQTNFTSSGLVNGETVGSVTLTASGGTQAEDAVGIYTLIPSEATGGTFSLSNYSTIYNSGTLTVLDAPTIVTVEDWAAQKGLTGDDAALDADPDGDGMSNLMEYFLGLEPMQSGGTNNSSMLVAPGPGSTVTMTYRRAKWVTNVSSAVQASADLSSSTSWGTNGVHEDVVDKGFYEEVTATVTNAPGETRKFMRLKVSQP